MERTNVYLLEMIMNKYCIHSLSQRSIALHWLAPQFYPVLYTVALQSYTPYYTHIQGPEFLVYFEPKSLEPKLTFFHLYIINQHFSANAIMYIFFFAHENMKKTPMKSRTL